MSLVDKLSTVRLPGPMVRAFLWLRHALRVARRWLTPVNADVIERTLALAEARGLGIAAELDLAERLAPGPVSSAELAFAAGVDADACERLLLLLATAGYFRRDRQGRWHNTRLSEALRASHPLSARQWARFFGGADHFRIWAHADAAVRSGQSATRAATGHEFFDWITRVDPQAGERFAGAMLDGSRFVAQAFESTVDLEGAATFCDVGGGTGRLLLHLLSRRPAMRGVLFDLPEVVAGASEVLGGVAGRVEIIGGSFFERVPAGLDRYLLLSVLHDWNDERAAAILAACRAALTPAGRLLVVEQVVEPRRAPLFERHSDVLMLVLSGSGRERTDGEFRRLFAAAGLEATRTWRLATLQQVYELIPAPR
jgi:hypothetical protein